MDPEERKRWDEFDARMKIAEKQIRATGNLVQPGIPMLVDTRIRIDVLMESEARLDGHMQELAEAQVENRKELSELAKAQKETLQSLKAFLDSMKKGGNGSNG